MSFEAVRGTWVGSHEDLEHGQTAGGSRPAFTGFLYFSHDGCGL